MSTVTETRTSEPAVVVASQPQAITVVPPRILDEADRRRWWAVLFLFGGGIAMTLYASAALSMLQGNPHYVFYLGLAAMVNILMIFTGLTGLLVKRTLNVSKTGIIVEDHDSQDKSS